MVVTTSPENVTGWVQLVIWANANTLQLMGIFLIYAVFLVSFLSMKRFETAEAFGASSFAAAVLALPMYYIGNNGTFIDASTPLIFGTLFVASVFWLGAKHIKQ